MNKSKPQIFPQPYQSASCDVYACYKPSKWFVGRPDGPLNLCLKLCDKCMEEVLGSVPHELKEAALIRLVPGVPETKSAVEGVPDASIMVDEKEDYTPEPELAKPLQAETVEAVTGGVTHKAKPRPGVKRL